MCSYIVKTATLTASCAKGANGWGPVDTAHVYYDHPFHSTLDHALGIDIISSTEGEPSRLALELSPEAARALVAAIEAALAAGEQEHGIALGREVAAL